MAKCLFNSTVSMPGTQFMTCDIKDFYLNTPMAWCEYMRLPLDLIPPAIVAQYNLATLAHQGWVYIEINKGMYGLPQAGILANDQLTKHLAKYGYQPAPHMPGLWQHDTWPIVFTLVVDNFGI